MRLINVSCFVLLSAPACVMDASQPGGGEPSSASLVLSGSGDELVLEQARTDSATVGGYPNPAGLDLMVVHFSSDGGQQLECYRGWEVPCTASPFLTFKESARAEDVVVVVDIHGETVARLNFPQQRVDGLHDSPSEPDEEDGCRPEEDGAEPSPGEDGGGGHGTEDDVGHQGGLGSDPGDGQTDDAAARHPMDSECGERALCNDCCQSVKERHCDALFANMAEQGIEFDFDCLGLGAELQVPPRPWITTSDAVPCHDLVDYSVSHADCSIGDEQARSSAHNFVANLNLTLIANGICAPSPLVLDLDNDGIELVSAADGVQFDLLALGQQVRTGWVSGDDGLLALDLDGNMRIDSGAELFGTFSGGRLHNSGFAALSEYDVNRDGMIDRRDPVYGRLLVWQDRNGDGLTDVGELSLAQERGIAALSLDVRHTTDARHATGAHIPLLSTYRTEEGAAGALVPPDHIREGPRAGVAGSKTCRHSGQTPILASNSCWIRRLTIGSVQR